eukprot:Colp12_sorted_trinity150504_noHs@34371
MQSAVPARSRAQELLSKKYLSSYETILCNFPHENLNRLELRSLVQSLHLPLPEPVVESLIVWCDPHNEDNINEREFAGFVERVARSGAQPAKSSETPVKLSKPKDMSWDWYRDPANEEKQQQRRTPVRKQGSASSSTWMQQTEDMAPPKYGRRSLGTNQFEPSRLRDDSIAPPWSTHGEVSDEPSRKFAGKKYAVIPPINARSERSSSMSDDELIKQLNRQVTSEVSTQVGQLKNAFAYMDRGRTGFIDKKDFRRLCHQYNFRLRENLLENLMEKCDVNADGRVKYSEFSKFFVSEAPTPAVAPVMHHRAQPSHSMLFG